MAFRLAVVAAFLCLCVVSTEARRGTNALSLLRTRARDGTCWDKLVATKVDRKGIKSDSVPSQFKTPDISKVTLDPKSLENYKNGRPGTPYAGIWDVKTNIAYLMPQAIQVHSACKFTVELDEVKLNEQTASTKDKTTGKWVTKTSPHAATPLMPVGKWTSTNDDVTCKDTGLENKLDWTKPGVEQKFTSNAREAHIKAAIPLAEFDATSGKMKDWDIFENQHEIVDTTPIKASVTIIKDKFRVDTYMKHQVALKPGAGHVTFAEMKTSGFPMAEKGDTIGCGSKTPKCLITHERVKGYTWDPAFKTCAECKGAASHDCIATIAGVKGGVGFSLNKFGTPCKKGEAGYPYFYMSFTSRSQNNKHFSMDGSVPEEIGKAFYNKMASLLGIDCNGFKAKC